MSITARYAATGHHARPAARHKQPSPTTAITPFPHRQIWMPRWVFHQSANPVHEPDNSTILLRRRCYVW